MDAETFALLQTRGMAIGLVMLLVTVVLLPRHERKLLLTGLVMLAIAALCLVPWTWSAAAGLQSPGLQYVALFLLLTSICRTGFLLVVAGRPHRILFINTPKILLDLCQVFAFVGVILILLRVAGVEASSLLEGSAFLTAAVGFMMKDTLGNIFSGLAIQLERPFVVGDWIQFDPDKSRIGKVLEINWRTTRLLTLDEAEVIIPHGAMAAASIVVYTQPTRVSRRSIYFVAPYTVPPQEVHRIVMQAIADMPLVVKQPAPSIVTLDFTERGIQYWLRIFTTEIQIRDRIDGEARDRIWYALQRQGISMPPVQHRVRLRQVKTPSIEHRRNRRTTACLKALRSVDFFRNLPEPALRTLAARVKKKLYAAGECLMREAEHGTQLFILKSGSIRISKRTPSGDTIEIDQIKAPGFVGEMSLLTGAPRSATVSAIEPTRCYVVDKEALSIVLKDSPQLTADISDVIGARYEHQASSMAAADVVVQKFDKIDLLERIRDFFRVRLY